MFETLQAGILETRRKECYYNILKYTVRQTGDVNQIKENVKVGDYSVQRRVVSFLTRRDP